MDYYLLFLYGKDLENKYLLNNLKDIISYLLGDLSHLLCDIGELRISMLIVKGSTKKICKINMNPFIRYKIEGVPLIMLEKDGKMNFYRKGELITDDNKCEKWKKKLENIKNYAEIKDLDIKKNVADFKIKTGDDEELAVRIFIKIGEWEKLEKPIEEGETVVFKGVEFLYGDCF